jgi:hypothetical protein
MDAGHGSPPCPCAKPMRAAMQGLKAEGRETQAESAKECHSACVGGGKVDVGTQNQHKKAVNRKNRLLGTCLIQRLPLLWKDADPDIPILKEAKAECAKLR